MSEIAKGGLNVCSTIFGLLAAGLWFYASRVQIEDDPADNNFKITEEVGGRRINILNSAKAQTIWNARASTCAAIAAACQASMLFFG